MVVHREAQHLRLEVPLELAGQRLDRALATLLPGYSRSQVQDWIQQGLVQVAGEARPQRARLEGGEQVDVTVPVAQPGAWRAEPMPLDIRYEDEFVLVLNKAAGLVVHPGAGNPDGTLLNALLAHAPELAHLPRAGLVHRLDKDTSGLLVVARREDVRLDLIEQIRARHVSRVYRALVQGRMIAGGRVDAPIGRHTRDRLRMAVVPSGKPSVTHYHVRERYAAHTDLEVHLESGRTHQIRVHMAHIRHPVIGDPVYGSRSMAVPGAPELTLAVRNFPRQALHAARLAFDHPVDGRVEFEAELPSDLESLRMALSAHARNRS
ncbi:MAG TPA: 23S rRNA pseudouridine(1911/1915/1917) synthase RluD [Acidiferrobacteraceae bacterium]|nr:23S rRNA pseudouridine(1911/1915/1917) synthase RluD [Acidiferrobacteraceae bacterium]